MPDFIEDCLEIIIDELKSDPNSLYSCILVNRLWCIVGVQTLRRNPYKTLTKYYKNASKDHKSLRFKKFYNMIIYLLPTSSKQLLIENDVIPISTPFSNNKPLFNYISFSLQISTDLVNEMGLALIKDHENKEKYKLLEQEYYKLFINNCNNITEFNWTTDLPLCQYPGASTLFSQLHTLSIDSIANYNPSSFSENLFEMAKICQNIEVLEVWYRYDDNPGLIKFIDNQKNLQSLVLHNYFREPIDLQLSEAIERKAGTLIKLNTQINLISTKIFPSLINLMYLELSSDSNGQGIQELQKYLSIASFPKLQYLITRYISRLEVCMLIEKSHGGIKKISITNNQNFGYTKRLYKTIAINCPKIKSLSIDIQYKNLSGIKEIFLNCMKLSKLRLFIEDIEDEEDNCDEILNILADYSPKTFNEFSFNRVFIFSVDGLKNFFERWRGRIPLKIYASFYDYKYFTQDHIDIMEKYFNEGVIDIRKRYLYG